MLLEFILLPEHHASTLTMEERFIKGGGKGFESSVV